jgi:hypothetical protein
MKKPLPFIGVVFLALSAFSVRSEAQVFVPWGWGFYDPLFPYMAPYPYYGYGVPVAPFERQPQSYIQRESPQRASDGYFYFCRSLGQYYSWDIQKCAGGFERFLSLDSPPSPNP